MAQASASINLEVKGTSKLERLIQSVSRLESIVSSINAAPLKLDVAKTESAFYNAQLGIKEVRDSISKAQKDFNDYDKVVSNLEKSYQSSARAASKLTVGTQKQIDALLEVIQIEGRLSEAKKKRTRLEERLNKEESKLPGAQRYLEETKQAERLTRALVDLSDEYLKLGRYQTRTPVTGKIAADQSKIGSIAQLRGQAEALALIASNSEVASKQFNRFTIASQVANQKVFEARQRQLKALAEGLALPEGREARRQVGTRVGSQESLAGARNAVASLISFFPEVAKSEAALSSYASELESLRSLVPIASSEFIQLSNAIKVVGDELSRVGDVNRQFGPSQFIDVAPSGPVSDRLNSLKQQRKYAEDVNREYRRQTDLAEEISRAAIGVTDREALSLRLNRALDALGENRLEDAQAITREVQKQLKLQKELLSSKPTRVFGVAGQDFMPISGAMAAPAGIRNLAAPGSPAARRLEQEAIAAWVQRGGPALPEPPKGALRTPIKGSVDIPGSPKYEKEANKQKERALDLTSRIDGIQKRILLSTASDRAQQELLNDVYSARNALLEGNFREAKRIAGQIDRNRFAYERQNKALDDEKSRRQRLQNQFRKLETLQNNYLLLERKGVKFQEEKIQLQDVLAKAVRNPEKVTKDYVNSLDQAITKFRLLAGQRVSEAKLAGAYGGPTTSRQQSAATVEASRQNILGQALGVEKQLLQLESKGYSVATQKLEVQEAIAQLKQLEGRSTTAANDALRAQVSTLRLLAKEEGNRAFIADEQVKKINEANRAEKKLSEAIGIAGGAAQRLVGLENTQNLIAAVNDYVGGLRDVESAAGRVLDADKKAEQSFDARLKAADKFKDQLLSIQKLQSDYTTAEKAGAQFLQEKLDLQELVNAAAGGQIEVSAENVRLLDSQIGRFKKFLALRVSEAKSTGAYAQAARPQSAEKVESTRRRLLDQALGVQRQLITLDQKGGEVAQDKIEIEKLILDVKNKQNSSTQAENELLAQQIGLLKTAAKEEANRLAALPKASGGKAAGPEGTGLEAALKRLEEARGARQKFLGDVSAPEAIDKIVREFNKDSATGTASEAAQAAENVVGTYASKITAGVPAVADAMMKLGKAGIDAIKKALGIASPSIVMLAIAKNQIDTYVDFLRSALPQVEAAAKAIGEAGTPKPAGVPESAIRKPITEKARTRPLTAEQLDRNGAIAEFAASQITGPRGQFEQVKRKIEDFIDKTRTSVDLDKLFGGQEDERFAMATRGKSAGPEFDKIRAALADFYQIPAELTPDLERGVKAAGDASTSADELTKYVSELTTGIEQIGVLLQSAAKLPIPTAAAPAVAVDDEFTRAQEAAAKADAAAAEAARKKAEAQKPFEASIQRAAELDAEAKRKADSAVSSVVQAQIEVDARAGAEAISKAILDPIESAAPEGERQVRSAIGNLFDRVAGALGFGGAGGGGRPPVPPTGGSGGPTRDPGDFNRRLSTAAEQGAEALLGLRELRDPTKATTVELEALSGVLKEFRGILDPTTEGFERLDKQLRESAANLDRQLERRAPDAGFLTRRFGPRTARGLSEGLIGGAFPLLFGQGLGAAVGGGLGGGLGGFAGGGLGFGLSLVGTALGTAFDTLSQAAQDTGAALNYPIEGFEKLKEAGLFASRQQEYYISKLIETGRTAEATAKIQARIVEVIGVQGANDLMSLGDSASLLGKKWSELNYQMQALVAGPVGGFLELLAKVAGAKVESNRLVGLGERISQLTPEQRRIFQEEARKISATDYTKGAEALLDRIAPQQLKQPKEDPAQVERDLNKSIETAEKIRALRQQGTALERNAQDLRLSIEDTVYGLRRRAADMEREAAEFRRSVEDQVFSKRQELEQKLIENDRKRQQNAIDAFDLQLQRASTGLDPIAQGIVEAARQYLRVRAEGEADLQQNERQLKLQLQQIDQEVARYRLQVEDRISQMSIQRDEFTRDVAKTKLQLERQIGDYVIQVEEYRLAMAKHRYELEIDLEKKKQIAAQSGLMGGGGPVDRLIGSAAQREKFVQDQLVRRGFTPEQMAAVMGSIRQESGFNPYAQEQGGTGLGLFQWSFGRRAKVPAFTGNWQKDIQNQLDLFQRELNTTEKKAGEILMGATTLQGAAAGMKQFERYGVTGRRYDYMKDYYTRLTGGAGVPVSQQMEPGFTETFDLNAPSPTAPTAPTMPELPGAPRLVQVNDLLTQYVDLQARIKKALEENNLAEARRIQLQAESARLAFEQQTLSPIRQFQEQNRELQFEIEKRQLRNRLLIEGVKPEIVEGELRVLEINRALNSVLEGLEITTNEQVKAELERVGVSSDLVDSTFRLTEATLASLVATTQDVEKQEELRKKLQEILDLRDRLASRAESEADGVAAGARGIAAEQARPGQKIQEFIAQATTELQDLEAMAVRISQGIGDAVGNSIANGISGLIEGTTTAKEVFAGFLKDVGRILIQQATSMIATYAAIGIARMFAFGGSGVSGGAGGAGASDLPAAITSISPVAANGAYFANGIAAFAKGGMFTNSVVSSPTLFQFADGGVTRTGLMGEAGPEAIMPLERGPDGKLGVAAHFSENRQAMKGGSSGGPAGAFSENREAMNATATVERERMFERVISSGASSTEIKYSRVGSGDLPFVTEEDMLQASRIAAQEGARLGQQRTLAALKNNPAARRSVGI